MAGRFQIGVEEGIGLAKLLFTNEIHSSVIEIVSVGVEELSMPFAILWLHLSALIGVCINGVERFKDVEHFLGQIEERCCVVLLLQIELLVALVVLFLHSIEHDKPQPLVPHIGCVGEVLAHELFCSVEIVASLQEGLGLCDVFLHGSPSLCLQLGRRWLFRFILSRNTCRNQY